MSTYQQQTGMHGEHAALAFLQNEGLKLVIRNFKCKVGEIDLIMEHGEHIVFVEVRYRSQSSHGGGLQSIDSFKQKKLIRTAHYYLQINRLTHSRPSRFDVIALAPTPEGSTKVTWIRNAFYAE